MLSLHANSRQPCIPCTQPAASRRFAKRRPASTSVRRAPLLERPERDETCRSRQPKRPTAAMLRRSPRQRDPVSNDIRRAHRSRRPAGSFACRAPRCCLPLTRDSSSLSLATEHCRSHRVPQPLGPCHAAHTSRSRRLLALAPMGAAPASADRMRLAPLRSSDGSHARRGHQADE